MHIEKSYTNQLFFIEFTWILSIFLEIISASNPLSSHIWRLLNIFFGVIQGFDYTWLNTRILMTYKPDPEFRWPAKRCFNSQRNVTKSSRSFPAKIYILSINWGFTARKWDSVWKDIWHSRGLPLFIHTERE